MQEITIVGGGIGGLVAAIHVARGGGRARLHEASSRLAGRARTDSGPYRVNVGPHALYGRREFGRWLTAEKLRPPFYYPSMVGLRLMTGGKLRRSAPGLLKLMRSAKRSAPVDEDYRSWANRVVGPDAVETAVGFASLPTYHGDPGALSAAFVQERVARSLEWRPVWYFAGGWSKLIDALSDRARSLGVEIETGSKVTELPDGISIVATDLAAAARLLSEPDLDRTGTRCALFDVALEARRGDPTAVLDLDGRVYASSFSAGDPSVAPEGENLLQIVAGVREGEADHDAHSRIERVLDTGYPSWRSRMKWKRKGISQNGTGPADAPGTGWQDRPAIDRGAGRFLVGDRVAAPGLLAEVSFASARLAALAALDKAR